MKGFLNEQAWLAAADALARAPFEGQGWIEALARIAEATGSRGTHLVGFSPTALRFSEIADPEPEWIEIYETLGGNDPLVNPRMQSALNRQPFALLTDSRIMDAHERKRHHFYQEILPPLGLPFICATPVLIEPELTIGIALLRTQRQGEADAKQEQCFSVLAHHVRSAVRTQLLLEAERASIVAGALDAVTAAAIICDAAGHVHAFSEAAEELLRRSDPLTIKHGRLAVSGNEETKQLRQAIASVAQRLQCPGQRSAVTVVVRDKLNVPLPLEVLRLPEPASSLSFSPAILVLARGVKLRKEPDQLQLMRAAFGLTEAEAEVAAMIAKGKSLGEIAAQRERSLETIRAQLRAIYAKLGVRRQSELAALLNRLR